MITRKLLTASILTLIAVMSVDATAMAQGVTRRRPQVTDHRNRPKPPPRAPNVTDHRNKPKPPPRAGQPPTTTLSFEEASKMMAPYRQWKIGAIARTTGKVLPQSHRVNASLRSYNIKGKKKGKFLQYEKQGAGRGINLGWTSKADEKTAIEKSQWHFLRTYDETTPRPAPLKYGEPFALAWDWSAKGWGAKNKPFVKYAKRNVGINLDWSKTPSYEWVILGGRPGTEVLRTDWVILYNLNHKQPLRYFDRTVGGNIGWPDSTRWGPDPVRKKSDMSMSEIVKPLMR